MDAFRIAAQLRWWLASLGRPLRGAWRALRRPARVRLHGVWLELGADVTPALRRLVYREGYERGEARCVLLRLEPHDVVLEVGAGAGFVTTLCARRVGSERVVSYEANPALLPRIRATLAANGVAPRLVNAVLAREAGEAELFVEREFVSSSTQRRSTDADPLRVPRLAANAELRRVRPTCLVVDIEGGESELLPLLDLTGVRKLILELHPHVIGAERCADLVALLAAQGFREDRWISSTRKKYFEREAA
jgi:FkbM family methyltransferase